MKDQNEEKKVWKFSYQMWNKEVLEGTFVATQDGIDWISDQIINFGDKANNDLDVVVRMDPEYLHIMNEDPTFVEQFQKTIGATGISPFAFLNDEQREEWDTEFGETYINGVLVKGNRVKPPLPPYEDQDNRVITHSLTGDIFNYDVYDDEHSKEMEKFLQEFEILTPDNRNEHFLSRGLKFEGDSFDCMYIIKRKSDGDCYGYPYTYSLKYGHDDSPNGNKHGVDSEAYVWLPVKPYIITGYSIATD